MVKDPAEYNIYEILYAAEDSIALVSCLEDDVEPCPMFNDCLTAPLWQYLQDEFRHVMERVSLQDVIGPQVSSGIIERVAFLYATLLYIIL